MFELERLKIDVCWLSSAHQNGDETPDVSFDVFVLGAATLHSIFRLLPRVDLRRWFGPGGERRRLPRLLRQVSTFTIGIRRIAYCPICEKDSINKCKHCGIVEISSDISCRCLLTRSYFKLDISVAGTAQVSARAPKRFVDSHKRDVI